MLDRSTLELFDNATNKRKQIQNLAKMYMTTPERIVDLECQDYYNRLSK